jgi:predicted RNA methylase
MILPVIILIIVCAALIATLFLAYDKIIVGKVPYIPIPQPTLEEIIDNIPIAVGGIFYDLGCGDGRVLITAHKKQPNAIYIGIEKAFLPYWQAKFNTLKYPNIHIKRGDILKTYISKQAVVFCYLLPELLIKLPEFNNIVSVEYQIPNRQAIKTVQIKNRSRLVERMFFYK